MFSFKINKFCNYCFYIVWKLKNTLWYLFVFFKIGVQVDRAHLLSTVINNLELMPDYYTKCILSFLVFEGDSLCTKFREHGVVGKKKSESEET